MNKTLEYTIGKQLYRCGQPVTFCRTKSQKEGYMRAIEQAGIKQAFAVPEQSPVEFWTQYNSESTKWREDRDAMCRRYNDGDVVIYHDYYANWITVELYGETILDTRPPWNAASAGVYAGKSLSPDRSGYNYGKHHNINEQVPSIQ